MILNVLSCFAQAYDEGRIVLGNFVERLYRNTPFEGCRIVDDYENSYLLSIVALDASKYKTKAALNRMSQVKSQRSAGEFLNGTQSVSEFVIKTPKSEEKEPMNDILDTFDHIKTNSTGFIQQMQLLTSFVDDDNLTVFVYFKELK